MKKLIVLHCTCTRDDRPLTTDDVMNLYSENKNQDPMPFHYIIDLKGRVFKIASKNETIYTLATLRSIEIKSRLSMLRLVTFLATSVKTEPAPSPSIIRTKWLWFYNESSDNYINSLPQALKARHIIAQGVSPV